MKLSVCKLALVIPSKTDTPFAGSIPSLIAFSLTFLNSNLLTCSPFKNVVPPWSVISIFCNICLTITSICLSLILTPCNL